MPKLAARRSNSTLTLETHRNLAERRYQLIRQSQRLLRDLARLPPEERAASSYTRRAKMGRELAFKRDEVSQTLIDIAIIGHPEHADSATRLSEHTGITRVNISKRMSKQRKRPPLNRSQLRREFMEATAGLSGKELIEASKRVRKRLGDENQLPPEIITEILLESHLQDPTKTKADIQRETGLSKAVVDPSF